MEDSVSMESDRYFFLLLAEVVSLLVALIAELVASTDSVAVRSGAGFYCH